MGDVVRLSSCSFRFSSPSSSSSSSPSSSSASFNTILQLGCLPIHQYLNKRVSAVADSAAPGTALASPRSLIRPISKLHRPTSFKVRFSPPPPSILIFAGLFQLLILIRFSFAFDLIDMGNYCDLHTFSIALRVKLILLVR
ncbi:hypothetical protein Dimus_003289 [Dionaea muscipula]